MYVNGFLSKVWKEDLKKENPRKKKMLPSSGESEPQANKVLTKANWLLTNSFCALIWLLSGDRSVNKWQKGERQATCPGAKAEEPAGESRFCTRPLVQALVV